MELLDDVCHMESRFDQFWCNIGVWLVLNEPYTQKSFWTHMIVLLGEEDQVQTQFGPFGDSANIDAR